MATVLSSVGNVLSMLGVPPLHRMQTARVTAAGILAAALISSKVVDELSRRCDISRLNTAIAFWRNFFCVWKDLYPLFLTRLHPALVRFTPLAGVVCAHQFLGGTCINLYVGISTILVQHTERKRLASWQALSRAASRQSFSALLKTSDSKRTGAVESAANGIMSVEGRRILEDELERDIKTCGAAIFTGGCRVGIATGFMYLATFGAQLTGFVALCRGIAVMLGSLALLLTNARHRLNAEWRDTEDALSAIAHLLGERQPDRLPTLLQPEDAQGIHTSARRLALLGALVIPNDGLAGLADSNARPWHRSWTRQRAARLAQGALAYNR